MKTKFLPLSSVTKPFFSFVSSVLLIINIPYHIFNKFASTNLYHEHKDDICEHIVQKSHQISSLFSQNRDFWKYILKKGMATKSVQGKFQDYFGTFDLFKFPRIKFKSFCPSVRSIISLHNYPTNKFLPKFQFTKSIPKVSSKCPKILHSLSSFQFLPRNFPPL